MAKDSQKVAHRKFQTEQNPNAKSPTKFPKSPSPAAQFKLNQAKASLPPSLHSLSLSSLPPSPIIRMSSRVNIRKLSSFISHNGRMTTLDEFLKIDCKSGKIDVSDAHFFFDHMLRMRPSPPLSGFKALLGALVKSEHSPLAVSFYKRLDISGALGPTSDFIILNILLNSYSRMRLGSAAFSVVGLLYKNGYRPNIITFNSLLKGLCLEGEMVEALRLFSKMIQLGCTPDVVTYNTIIDGLCKTENAATAL